MDFSAWFEAYLGGRWYTFDARHNKPRIGRILMARGRDATDVAIVTSFGPCQLSSFKDLLKRSPRPRTPTCENALRCGSAGRHRCRQRVSKLRRHADPPPLGWIFGWDVGATESLRVDAPDSADQADQDCPLARTVRRSRSLSRRP
jgi:hypothetical protein